MDSRLPAVKELTQTHKSFSSITASLLPTNPPAPRLMGRRGSASWWLGFLVALLAVSPVPSCAAAEVKTSPTEWSFHLPLPTGVTGAESLAFDARGQGPYTGVSDGRVLK
ncbi:hypothetical protein ZWY2020_057963 [Hordeum vulgare]|nr:hypothetical protein ZWY2020_057963 [Hordeum vulgare]